MKIDYSKFSGTFLFLGTFQFIILMIVSEALYPSYSISKNYISDLGVGGTAYIFNTSIIIFGLFVLISSYPIFLKFKLRPFLVSMMLAGIGAIGVGMFPEGSPYYLHTIMSLAAFLFGGISSILSYKILNLPLNIISATCGVITLTALVLYTENIYIMIGPGGMERLIVYPILLWVLGFSGHLMASNK
ncbi:MAG: DUF998 domain-containing protein [Nitrososphaerota archaeon]|jgi:hypothetical membrane protein|nr:DUF998 domain-containing protein [Nitrososphaerota archaeon]MDG6928346.1 DUF998 domain-containing protein [Nitrososphaerota archaeon]MDG6930685.1 DUF998 domain-containing protein [Nitrososphaerota archaeon]MDG6932576.1 DUF998 domain-containing protein [Nitrososphaerota archaeon]MDG6935652.1 DUF998 domain-containing protein [Nitrososphaerota archaeon]